MAAPGRPRNARCFPPAKGESRLAGPALTSLVLGLAIFGAEAKPASAQNAANLYGMQFLVTPYLWLSGINAAVKTPLERARRLTRV